MTEPNNEITGCSIYLVRAFIEDKYQGNPAGVCLLPEKRSTDYFAKVAKKIGASETAFVYVKDSVFQLRWFTRNGSEVDLCGHATLATAHILWDKKYVDVNETIYFNTNSGILSARKKGELISLNFPLDNISQVNDCEYDFGDLLGITPIYLGRTKFDYLVVINSEDEVKAITPNFDKLKSVRTRGIIITAKSDSSNYDYVARFFAPSVGINEDPVTGSAHSCLGIYWSSVLGKNKLNGYQASQEGGIVRVAILKNQIRISGKAKEVRVSDKSIILNDN
jgi:PhzF family phenazine biosynthesis protein